jgi:translation elongation factor P/translation initiation factor 5A
MDQDTYEETRLGRDDWAKFLKEGAICSLLFYSGKVGQQHSQQPCYRKHSMQ